MNETWKPIPSDPRYEASTLGRIRGIRGRIMNPSSNGRGKGYLGLMVGGKSRKVHVLVCEAFLGPRPEGKCINHIDGNPSNNSPSNLEYVTPAENVQHAYRTGLLPKPPFMQGEAHARAIFTDEDIRSIRARHAAGESTRAIARAIQVGASTVRHICNRTRWGHVK